jgi:hypothetical protein
MLFKENMQELSVGKASEAESASLCEAVRLLEARSEVSMFDWVFGFAEAVCHAPSLLKVLTVCPMVPLQRNFPQVRIRSSGLFNNYLQ